MQKVHTTAMQRVTLVSTDVARLEEYGMSYVRSKGQALLNCYYVEDECEGDGVEKVAVAGRKARVLEVQGDAYGSGELVQHNNVQLYKSNDGQLWTMCDWDE